MNNCFENGWKWSNGLGDRSLGFSISLYVPYIKSHHTILLWIAHCHNKIRQTKKLITMCNKLCVLDKANKRSIHLSINVQLCMPVSGNWNCMYIDAVLSVWLCVHASNGRSIGKVGYLSLFGSFPFIPCSWNGQPAIALKVEKNAAYSSHCVR